jgi:hypothetical protein
MALLSNLSRKKDLRSQHKASKPAEPTVTATVPATSVKKSKVPLPAMTEGSLPTPQISGKQSSILSVLRVHSLTSIEIESEPHLPTFDRVPAIVSNVVTPLSLWEEAQAQVDDTTTLAWMKALPALKDAKHPFPELVALVRLREDQHVKDAPKLKIGDREVLWRDYAEMVVGVVITIGDITINFAPTPSAAIWSGVKVLLKVSNVIAFSIERNSGASRLTAF